jgi:hypothetical protein
MNNLVDSLKDEGFGVMGRDQVLKTCLLLSNSPHVFVLRNFNKRNIYKIEENWEETQKSIFSTVKILSDLGYRGQLSSAYIISSIAYFCYLKQTVTDDDKIQIRNFVRMAQIKSYFTTSLDRKLDVVGNIIKGSASFSDINKQLFSDRNYPLYINEEDINRFIDLSYGNLGTFSVLQILYPHLDYKNSKFHIDHIFPKSKFTTKNKLLDPEYIGRENELFNLQMLEGEANNAKRAKEPEAWAKDEYKTESAIDEYKKRNYIKEHLLLTWDNIEEFEKYRSETLINELKKQLL